MYLKLDIDGADGKALHPYPWIPPTGNVMYCMPQEGTEAYLYFPEAEEESAYAVSEIHNSRCPVFADAQRRELVTEHGKKLRLHADMLGFAGGKEETVQECRMREDGIHFGAGRGKLQVTGREQILFHAPEISLDAVQKIGQYKMESMAKETTDMVIKCVDAFVNKDLELARTVIAQDDVVDDLFADFKQQLIKKINENVKNGEQATDMLMVAKYFERIGDHATNIAEWVIYSITGEHEK